MKTCSKCREPKEIEDFSINSFGKDGRHSRCKSCRKDTNSMWYLNNKEYKDLQNAIWRKSNPDKVNSIFAKHRAQKRNATVAWADRDLIDSIYYVASMLSYLVPNQEYHVDHIISLKGKLVSGLHVHNNLSIIPATENRRKHNFYEPVNH